jgi:hypothetical protein
MEDRGAFSAVLGAGSSNLRFDLLRRQVRWDTLTEALDDSIETPGPV